MHLYKNTLIIEDPKGQGGEVTRGNKKRSLPAHPAYHFRGNKQMNKAADSSRGHEAIIAPTLLYIRLLLNIASSFVTKVALEPLK
jgi:hypothetical protein